MPTSSRRTRISVISRLLENPQDYCFVQAVRLLERAAILSNNTTQTSSMGAALGKDNAAEKKVISQSPVARFSPPTKEVLRFCNNAHLDFPENELASISQVDDKERQYWQVITSFIGLTGSMGVMPFHYTELVLKRIKQKDESLSEFLDLFHHRTTSLFFQASAKYRLPLEYERYKLHNPREKLESNHTQALLSVLGLGTNHLRNRQHIRDESLIYYSGLLTHQIKTPSGLEQFITSYFNVPAKIEGFIGQWQDLIDDVRTRLPSKTNPRGQNVCLGRSSMLGRRGWFAQGKSRVTIGPLNKEQFSQFAPGTGALRALNEMVATYLGLEQDYDFVIEVQREDVPNKIALKKDNPPLLAWNAWLSGKPKTNTEKDDLLEIVVSSKKLH